MSAMGLYLMDILYSSHPFQRKIPGAASGHDLWKGLRGRRLEEMRKVLYRRVYESAEYKKYRDRTTKVEAGNPGIPLRKIWVLCSNDTADRCLRIVGQDVRLPSNTSRCIAGHVYPYCSAECRDNRLLLLLR